MININKIEIEIVAKRTNFQLRVRPPLNHVVIYILKLIVWRGKFLAVEVRFIYFVQWEGFIPFCPGDFPEQYKRRCNILSSSLSSTESRSKKTTSAGESAFNIWATVSLGDQSFTIYSFLLNQLDLELLVEY